MWSFPLATTCGNTCLLKPSERVPLTAIRLAELATEVGLPPGVMNIMHGTHDTVNFLCDDERIQSLSFIGGNVAGQHIYSRGAQSGKRIGTFDASALGVLKFRECTKPKGLRGINVHV